jgi:hypothetical protein
MEAVKVKSFIESIYCPTHKEHPHVSVDGDHIHIECCCPSFQKQCNYLVKLLSRPGHETDNSTIAVV